MAYPGVLHQYSTQVAFEFNPSGHKKVIVVIGGLSDGLLTVKFAPGLAKAVEKLGFGVLQIQMRSSYIGWGTGSLDADVEDIKKLVEYLRSPEGGSRETIIIMGFSTGSQDVMHYLLRHSDSIEGCIFSAPVSDREGQDPKDLERLNPKAQELVANGQGNEILPREYANYVFNTPITAYRWCSLHVKGGDDDYFSTDLSQEVFASTFGKLDKPFLVAFNELDEYVPKNVNKPEHIKRWQSVSNPKYWSKNSGIVKGSTHTVAQPEAQQDLFQRVLGFLEEFSF
ncbi:hypothetical protein ZYGR_0S02030 [Zygosaccharomyces rouxii]|uniref:ZYRO0F07040p n=2 Tax=Zygosaccharomyces rouxii TaxID=4956 RepID=C5DXQ9_ZYGRC|nr:uncharacterized protein ZYRO0F07040g [Zygosaccharomyces rouxii]KAH9199329.1 hypothetical protein LQ764DRAFT_129247 [Zygosaccharomyces rouxii]GAV50069.1 hypothetical protein ZYGR_0S02030 [Zygosaccharomyces rouxii]CAR28570.1 ZYRO0F07040p [Zygosaccharomyces rouxii]